MSGSEKAPEKSIKAIRGELWQFAQLVHGCLVKQPDGSYQLGHGSAPALQKIARWVAGQVASQASDVPPGMLHALWLLLTVLTDRKDWNPFSKAGADPGSAQPFRGLECDALVVSLLALGDERAKVVASLAYPVNQGGGGLIDAHVIWTATVQDAKEGWLLWSVPALANSTDVRLIGKPFDFSSSTGGPLIAPLLAEKVLLADARAAVRELFQEPEAWQGWSRKFAGLYIVGPIDVENPITLWHVTDTLQWFGRLGCSIAYLQPTEYEEAAYDYEALKGALIFYGPVGEQARKLIEAARMRLPSSGFLLRGSRSLRWMMWHYVWGVPLSLILLALDTAMGRHQEDPPPHVDQQAMLALKDIRTRAGSLFQKAKQREYEAMREMWVSCAPSALLDRVFGRQGGRRTADRPAQEGQAERGQWLSATKAVEMANRITGVGRDWSTYWRRWVEQHAGEIKTRPGRTRDDQESKQRREVEIGSFLRAIIRQSKDFEKATPEDVKRQEAIRERLRNEYSILPAIKQQIENGLG